MPSKPFEVKRDISLDFVGESYGSIYPNLHRYPATMIPQLGIEILNRLGLKSGSLLDPYCGSGSSFASAIHVGFDEIYGFDLNPLAVLISKAKFTRVSPRKLNTSLNSLNDSLRRMRPTKIAARNVPHVTNLGYWFPKEAVPLLLSLKRRIDGIDDRDVRDLFLIAFSETIRDVSYTRKNEFKLYRIPADRLKSHKPDVLRIFGDHLKRIVDIYLTTYFPKLADVTTRILNKPFDSATKKVGVVLTSPPYGDSRTTVAYGQFSTLTNEWLGIQDARKIDSRLMGGKRAAQLMEKSLISSELVRVAATDRNRALEVSSFYQDLGVSIAEIAKAVRPNGYSIYIVGNRRVKDVQLSTDQFIAEQFESVGLRHVITYERLITNKSMPAVNSPSNKAGAVRGTMTQEFVVICQRVRN